MIIREAEIGDLHALATLLVAFNAVHASVLPCVYQPVIVDAETIDYLRRVMALEQTHVFVAVSDGQVAGMLILQRDTTPLTPVHVPRQWISISAVVVGETVRRQGIGTALIQHAQAWALERGITTVELIVAEGNAAAIAWYERLGFSTRERRMIWPRDDVQQD